MQYRYVVTFETLNNLTTMTQVANVQYNYPSACLSPLHLSALQCIYLSFTRLPISPRLSITSTSRHQLNSILISSPWTRTPSRQSGCFPEHILQEDCHVPNCYLSRCPAEIIDQSATVNHHHRNTTNGKNPRNNQTENPPKIWFIFLGIYKFWAINEFKNCSY